MKLSMNEATALEKSSLVKDLELCEKYNYDYIEIRTMDCLPDYLKNHSIDDLAEFFQTHKVKPLAFNTLCYFNNRKPEDYKKILGELKYMCEVGNKIGCNTVITVPTVDLEKVTCSQIRKSAVECLSEMADLAANYNMRLSVEFIGHQAASINTFGQAYSIIKEIDKKNLGITLDCFHFHGMASRIEDLEKADGNKIFIVHLNDTEDFRTGVLLDEDRVWPGDGCIKLGKIFHALKKIGWKEDIVSLELFRPEYYRMDLDDVYRIGKEKSIAVIDKIDMIEKGWI
ncbi:sugar phosphate isomerase/epimerase family protein [Pectinatus sottacetonis]|uniref:sugar phosphate isomerase/epimerase family protein n=1 Tax=Pectinatus sottacetonis TaxID=1002795 RepID=UPI0018C63A26|nr:sugar phosphate isomerase/epimerase [Pectinatus sottacetonis]